MTSSVTIHLLPFQLIETFLCAELRHLFAPRFNYRLAFRVRPRLVYDVQ